MKNKIAIIIIFIAGFCSQMQSQIFYRNNKLSVNESNPEWYTALRIKGYDGLYWTNSSGSFLKIDLSSDSTLISGSNDCVNFYDNDEQHYIAVFAYKSQILSDIRHKQNIATIADSKASLLRPVSYDLFFSKNKKSDISKVQTEVGESTRLGFIAQEVKAIYPESVKEDDFGNLMVNYYSLIPVLIKAIQELDLKVEEQTADLQTLIKMLAPAKQDAEKMSSK